MEPGTSGSTGPGHLSREDVQTLLETLKVKLPKEVLNDDVINKSKEFSSYAKNIMKKLKNGELIFAQKPRVQCGKITRALNLKSKQKIQDITEKIFFKRSNTNEKTLKEKGKIPLSAACGGCKMQETVAGTQNAHSQEMRRRKIQGQRNEMICLRYFVRENLSHLSDVRYCREHRIEYGFLSGRIDFIIKAKSSEAGPSEKIILECKKTKKDVKNLLCVTEGQKAQFKRNKSHYHQTQAYQYILTECRKRLVRAALVLRKYQKDDEKEVGEEKNNEDEEDQEEEDEEEDDEEYDDDDDDQDDDDDETDEEDDHDDQDEKYKKYEENNEELKGEFYCDYVRKDMRKFDKLNTYCKEEALPLYLAVLNQWKREREGRE